MAIGTPSQSPAIIVKEIDLSGVVPNVQSTTGAIVGNFRWGPIGERVRIGSETSLAAAFGNPDLDNTIDFHSAAYYLRYSSDLFVTREATTAAINAHSSFATGTNPLIKNRADFDAKMASLESDGHTFIAKWAGTAGNGLRVSVCPSDTTQFNSWAYNSSFDRAPGSSAFATDRGASDDEVHIAVIDENAQFGPKDAVLEIFPHVSITKDAKNADGSSNFLRDVVNNGSNYVWCAGFDAAYTTAGANTTTDSGDDFSLASPAVANYDLLTGVNSAALTPTEYATGFDIYEDADTVQVDFLIAPGMNTSADQATVTNDLVAIASARKDCLVVSSPNRAAVVGVNNPATITNNVTTTANTFTFKNNLVVDNNYLKVYDKYNDQYIKIAASSSTAGIMAAADANAAPWVSPAGARRGNYLGITSIEYSPNKTQRDTLYKAGINPISNIPGQGVLLFGDKTHESRPSAFDRINVRRLFFVLERAIAEAAKNVMFELNDEFTRAEFTNIVEPFLREVKGRRGITDFRVVCDETNNTANIIDTNQFVATIFIKPARSINFITLNFVAVRSGVEFEEVVGTV